MFIRHLFFLFPASTIYEIEKILRVFLWSGRELKKGNAKVKWDDVCMPKKEGGLGIKNLRTWNIALLTKHVWKIISGHNSLWVKWVKEYHVKDRNFWDIMNKNNMSWTWKRFLNIRQFIRKHIFYEVGIGDKVSAWHDWWYPKGILSEVITRRMIREAGFVDNTKVVDLVEGSYVNWPNNWIECNQDFFGDKFVITNRNKKRLYCVGG